MSETETKAFDFNSALKTYHEYQQAFEKYELEYWSHKFGVSIDKLNEAIGKVGLSSSAVENYLKASR